MAQLCIRVPENLREQVREAAEEQDVSLNQFCTVAIARAVGEAQARRFFARRAGTLTPDEGREKLLAILDKVP